MKKTIRENFWLIISAIKASGKVALTGDEIIAATASSSVNIVKAHVYQCKTDGLIRSVKIPQSLERAYSLSAAAEKIFENPDAYEVKPFKTHGHYKSPGKGRPALGRKTKPEDVQAVQMPLNISQNADDLLATVSHKFGAVVNENAAYREGIIRACNLLAGFVSMKLVPLDAKIADEKDNND